MSNNIKGVNNNKIHVFLDFDGVTHHFFPMADKTEEENKRFYYLPKIVDVLRDYPDVDIVISSTWRVDRTLTQLRQIFPVDFQNRVVGKTPQLPDYIGNSTLGATREREVLAWLTANNQSLDRWIALDDIDVNFKSWDKLVLCRDYFGELEKVDLKEKLNQLTNDLKPKETPDGSGLTLKINQSQKL